MKILEETKLQLKYLIMPVIWHILYLIFSAQFNSVHRVYCDLIFYLVLVIYFVVIDYISIRDLLKEWKKGKKFWIKVLYTAILEIIAFGISFILLKLLPNINDGMLAFKVVNIQTLIAFAVTTILLPPIAEEAFYRKAIINFDNKISLLISIAIGTLLYASEHSLKPLGFIEAMIWSVPFTAMYVKTRNIYIPLTAHLMCNIVFNGISTIIIAMHL
ncbi:MAG: CPBP family intramembrane metalloprotease [Caloramator sp.]|nr:CPBP family intramembrane metalloprotease [Caloramator sp.]